MKELNPNTMFHYSFAVDPPSFLSLSSLDHFSYQGKIFQERKMTKKQWCFPLSINFYLLLQLRIHSDIKFIFRALFIFSLLNSSVLCFTLFPLRIYFSDLIYLTHIWLFFSLFWFFFFHLLYHIWHAIIIIMCIIWY